MKLTNKTPKFYDLSDILKIDAQYNVIFGQRSNGKTYAVLKYILKQYHDHGKQGALCRRYLEDIRKNKLETIFSAIVKNHEITRMFKDKGGWTGIKYTNRKFYLMKSEKSKEDDKEVIDQNPFMYVFAVSMEENYKENSYPDITTIFFDEFLSRTGYLNDEFVLFMNLVSTIKRLRTDVKIFLVGNTINPYCPYFAEMGLKHAYKIPIGKIEVYTYGESSLKVAVQRAENVVKIDSKKDIDPYFAFDNPSLKMVTHGDWELSLYPHCPDITTIFFDEFLSRTGYLNDEFVLFMNLVSTIKRLRTDVKIFLVGNTINPYCPYFAEMGLKHAYKIPIGKIEVYTYGESSLKVAVQRAENVVKIDSKKDIDPYFAFDNPSLKMVTHGDWELSLYPHCPFKYLPKEIIFTYFIIFDDFIYQCEVIHHGNNWITFIHRKTSPIKNDDKDLVFQKEVSYRNNYRTRLTRPVDMLGKNILSFFRNEKVFYQDNEVGEAIRNYLMWCNQEQ